MCARMDWIVSELGKYGLSYIRGDIFALKTKLITKCLYCGETKSILFQHRKKNGCRKKDHESRKKPLSEIEDELKQTGYELISVQDSRLNLLCKVCGTPRNTTRRNLRKYPFCEICERNAKQEIKHKEISDTLSMLGYTALEVEERKAGKAKSHTYYIVKAQCQKGHITQKSYELFKSTCSVCHPKKLFWNFDSVHDWLKEHRPHLILEKYEKKRATLLCSKDGYRFNSDFAKFVWDDNDCAKCQNIAPLTLEEIEAVYHKEGYFVYLSDDTNTRSKILTTCPKGHPYTSNFIAFRDKGARCPQCLRHSKASKSERIICLWLEQQGFNIIKHNRTLLKGLEMDCYVQDHALGVEMNGLYYHSVNRNPHNQTLHQRKYDAAINSGIRLLQFWEDDVKDRLDAVKSKILVELNCSQLLLIEGIKCVVRSIEKSIADDFSKHNDLNHLPVQGRYLGLYFGEVLAMVAVYRIFRGVTYLFRVWQKNYINVIGGLTRIVQALPKPIVAYSDNMVTVGDVFEKAGFCRQKQKPPRFFYVRHWGARGLERLTPYSGPIDKTFKVYDAGRIVWVMN
jgi:very-short-patch-repair endonuclease